MDTLLLLEEADIDRIFKKLGPRVTFKARLKEWREAVSLEFYSYLTSLEHSMIWILFQSDVCLTVEELTSIAQDIIEETLREGNHHVCFILSYFLANVRYCFFN